MTPRRDVRFPIALLLAGCVEEGAETGFLLPSEVPVEWEGAWNAPDDGLGALVPVDVMVYDGVTGEPVEGVDVLVSTLDDGGAVLPVPVEGVLVVDDTEEGLWDASRDQYVTLDVDPAGSDPARVEELTLVTDDGGIARLYLYVDAFPEAGDDARTPFGRATGDQRFEDIPVIVVMATAEETFLLTPR